MHPPVSTTSPAPTAPTASSPPASRLVWADVAKGLCIVLVVLHHATSKHYGILVPEDLRVLRDAWLGLSEALKPLRMPLFFFLSGVFASSALNRPWTLIVRRRVAAPYYLYAVWLTLHAVVFSFAVALPMNRTWTPGELVADLAYASTGVWYLYALAVYFLLAKLLRPVDRRLVLGVAAVLSAACSALPIEEVNRVSVLQHFVFFVAGIYRPRLGHRLAELDRPALLPLLTLSYAAGGGVLWWVGAPRSVTTLLLSVVAIPLGIRLAVRATEMPRLSGILARLGRRTLPVYVLHMPLMALLHHLLTTALGEGELPGVAFVIYPVVAATLLTGGCLVVHSALDRVGAGFLFRLPEHSHGKSRSCRSPRVASAGRAFRQG